MTDQDYMQLAVELAEKGRGFTSPNPCVGAVVVHDNRVVGRGWHQGPGLPHAEVNAIEDAGPHASGATIYVTLEPCNHFGKTPPCTHLILSAGITRVVVGCEDPNPFVAGGGTKWLRQNGIDVQTGVMEQACRDLIEAFSWYVRHDRHPFVILKTAATLDGRIATRSGDSKWVTGESARRYGHQIRHEVDGILVGSGTVHADDPSLTARRSGLVSRDPVRIILDTNLGVDINARVMGSGGSGEGSHAVFFAGPGADEKKIAGLENRGARVIQVPLKNGRLDLARVMIRLGEIGIQSLLIEGGGQVAYSALHDGIVNKVMAFLAPRILGGDDGVPVCRGEGPLLMKDAFSLDRVQVRQFEQGDVLIQGYLKR